MGTGLRSQSLRESRHSYGKLQEPWGRPLKGQFRRAQSLRQGHEKSRARGLDGGAEGLEVPAVNQQPGGNVGDTEQLIQPPQKGSQWWRRQSQQVRKKWERFVACLPGVTLSRPASSEPPDASR